MRGVLRIASARNPYQRAGLAWSGTPIEIDIRDLDGARLAELVRDPVLSITVGQEGGAFLPMPSIDLRASADQLQMMIDGLAEELPPRPIDIAAEPEELATIAELRSERDQLAKQLDAIAERLKAGGHGSIDDLFDAYARVSDALAPIQAMADEGGRAKEETTADWLRAHLAELAALKAPGGSEGGDASGGAASSPEGGAAKDAGSPAPKAPAKPKAEPKATKAKG